MTKPVARLTTPAQMVAALPLQLGYVPTESIVVVCCHEPRGRMGLTMRFDLPEPAHEQLAAQEIERRVRKQDSTRVLIAVYTAEADGGVRARTGLVDELRERFDDLVVTAAVLVRDGLFWSYLCQCEACGPAVGTPIDDARESSSVRLIEAETVLRGRMVLPDREALEASIAGPGFLAAQVALQRCEEAGVLLGKAIAEAGMEIAAEVSLVGWSDAVDRFATPPAELGDMEAAALAVSLADVWVRDQLAASPSRDLPALLPLLEELARRTPAPYDAPVCALLAWVGYLEGGGALVTIAIERALVSDPTYPLAHLLLHAMRMQVSPKQLRKIARLGRDTHRRAS